MPDPFLDPILERISRVEAQLSTATRLGTVTAIDPTDLSLTVDLSGDPVSGVRWLKGYAPTVGDFVVITRMGTSWVVHDELSRDLTGPGYEVGQVTITPNPGLAGSKKIAPVAESWGWTYASNDLYQGRNVRILGTEYLTAGVAMYLPIATFLPDGATVTSAKVRFIRSAALWNDGSASNTTPLVSPVIYGHALTAEPVTQEPASLVVPGFGPWRPGGLARGQSGQWDLPSAWVTALLAQTIRGLVVWSDRVDEHTWWKGSGVLTLAYTVPA